jgi:hypothetical protein
MTLDDAQRKKVAAWIADGLKLSEIQNRITSELDLRMTYMDVRLLVDDLKLVPKDPEPAKPPAPIDGKGQLPTSEPPPPEPEEAAVPGNVSVLVDQLARPGALVSGKVTFSDGKKAEWYLDQTGRLGLAAQDKGYRPSQADVQQFQIALEAELAKLGL